MPPDRILELLNDFPNVSRRCRACVLLSGRRFGSTVRKRNPPSRHSPTQCASNAGCTRCRARRGSVKVVTHVLAAAIGMRVVVGRGSYSPNSAPNRSRLEGQPPWAIEPRDCSAHRADRRHIAGCAWRVNRDCLSDVVRDIQSTRTVETDACGE